LLVILKQTFLLRQRSLPADASPVHIHNTNLNPVNPLFKRYGRLFSS
jgi:hypothetical protein